MTTDRNGHVHGRDGRYSVKQQGEPGPEAALSDPEAALSDPDTGSVDDPGVVDGLDIEAEITRAHERAAKHRLAAISEDALGHRLRAYERLRDYPSDHMVHTVIWPEEPNGDGTFDVDLSDVVDGDGNDVEDIGGQGAFPAGWYSDVDSYRTAYDAWRVDSSDPMSPISIAKMREWRDGLDLPQPGSGSGSGDGADPEGAGPESAGPESAGTDGGADLAEPGDPRVIDALRAALTSDSNFAGSGWGRYRPVRRVEPDELVVGDLVAMQQGTFNRNLMLVVEIVRAPGSGRLLPLLRFVDPDDPNRPRTPAAPDLTPMGMEAFYRTSKEDPL